MKKQHFAKNSKKRKIPYEIGKTRFKKKKYTHLVKTFT